MHSDIVYRHTSSDGAGDEIVKVEHEDHPLLLRASAFFNESKEHLKDLQP